MAPAPTPRPRGRVAGLPGGARPPRLGGGAGGAARAGGDPGPPGHRRGRGARLPGCPDPAPASRRLLGGARGPRPRRAPHRGPGRLQRRGGGRAGALPVGLRAGPLALAPGGEGALRSPEGAGLAAAADAGAAGPGQPPPANAGAGGPRAHRHGHGRGPARPRPLHAAPGGRGDRAGDRIPGLDRLDPGEGLALPGHADRGLGRAWAPAAPAPAAVPVPGQDDPG